MNISGLNYIWAPNVTVYVLVVLIIYNFKKYVFILNSLGLLILCALQTNFLLGFMGNSICTKLDLFPKETQKSLNFGWGFDFHLYCKNRIQWFHRAHCLDFDLYAYDRSHVYKWWFLAELEVDNWFLLHKVNFYDSFSKNQSGNSGGKSKKIAILDHWCDDSISLLKCPISGSSVISRLQSQKSSRNLK